MIKGQEALTHKVGNSDGLILNSDPWTDCKALSVQVTGKSQSIKQFSTILYMFLKEYLTINVCFR